MRIAFLTYSFSMHINIKAKYFRQPEDRVLFFAMHPKKKMHQFDIPLKYQENMKVIPTVFENDYDTIKKNVWNIYKELRANKVKVIHIIDMEFAIYGILLRLLGIKVVLENNGSDVILAPERVDIRRKYWIAYKLANAVVQDSIVARNAGIKLGAKKKNNKVIELGIDTTIFHPEIEKGVFRRKYGIPDSTKIVFSPRTLRPLCNINEIIDTIKPIGEIYEDVIFVFCSPMRDSAYKNRIKKEQIEKNVLFLEYVDNETEMPYIYRDADLVLSIPNSDSSPRSVYEAMACGNNVIISDLPWIGKKFVNGKHVFIVKLHDKEQLLDTMKKILSGEVAIDEQTEYKRIKKILDYKIAERQLRELYSHI